MSDTNSKNASSTNKSNKQKADFYRQNKIEAEAYVRASERGFKNDDEMEDWLEAEIRRYSPIRKVHIGKVD